MRDEHLEILDFFTLGRIESWSGSFKSLGFGQPRVKSFAQNEKRAVSLFAAVSHLRYLVFLGHGGLPSHSGKRPTRYPSLPFYFCMIEDVTI